MDYKIENSLTRLVELMDSHPDMDAASVLEVWRNEREAARHEHAEQMRRMQDEQVFFVKQVELAEIRGAGDTVRTTLRSHPRIAV